MLEARGQERDTYPSFTPESQRDQQCLIKYMSRRGTTVWVNKDVNIWQNSGTDLNAMGDVWNPIYSDVILVSGWVGQSRTTTGHLSPSGVHV